MNIRTLAFKKWPTNPVYVCCSGGEDSIAASHYLSHYLHRGIVDFKIFHINCKFLPWDDLAHENVQNFCGAFKLKLCDFTLSKPEYKASNIEAHCRSLRISAMEDIGNAHFITGHHLSDAVESYLMNCFNGNPEYLPIPVSTEFKNKTIVLRPFLLTTKKQIKAYVAKYNLAKFVSEDPLNEVSNRGWLRRDVLPKLKERYPGIEKIVRKRYLKTLKEQHE